MPIYYNEIPDPLDSGHVARTLALISDKIGQSMYQQGITPQQMAADMEISIDTVGKYLSREYDFSIPELFKIEKYLQIKILLQVK
ncbi:MAG: helix-turn-helix transcriptional regulator [Rikenellaceae bacterium]